MYNHIMKTYVEQLEEKLAEMREEGLVHFSFTPAYNQDLDEETIAKGILDLMEAYESGNCAPIDLKTL